MIDLDPCSVHFLWSRRHLASMSKQVFFSHLCTIYQISLYFSTDECSEVSLFAFIHKAQPIIYEFYTILCSLEFLSDKLCFLFVTECIQNISSLHWLNLAQFYPTWQVFLLGLIFGHFNENIMWQQERSARELVAAHTQSKQCKSRLRPSVCEHRHIYGHVTIWSGLSVNQWGLTCFGEDQWESS